MKSRTSVSLLVGAAGLAAGLLDTSHARGQTLNWSNAAGGSAAVASNWNPNQIPTNVNDLVWNLANTYPVTFNATAAASRTHTYRRGIVTVTASNPHTISTGLTVGDLNGDVATMTFTGGTMTSNGLTVIGDAAGSTGTLNVNDDDADFILGGAASDMIVGSNGPGTLSITGGGLVSVADQFIAGSNATGTSTVTVSGQLSVNPFTRSTLDVNGVSQSRFGQGGDATVSISNGALASFAGDLVLGNGSASTSTATVQGHGLIANATLEVAGDLLLGKNTTAGSPGGVATLNVNADGDVVVGDTLLIAGDPDGGTATLHTATGALVTTLSLNIGAGATLDLDGGDVEVDGGTLQWSNAGAAATFNGGIGDPVLTMRNGALGTLNTVVGGVALKVGAGAGANNMDFDVRSGSDLTVSTGRVILGEGADDFGGMIINGTGSTFHAGSEMFVGMGGDGRFEAELEATVTGGKLHIAATAGRTADVLFETPGTEAAFDEIHVGGANGIPGGNGQLTVNAEAHLSVDGPGILMVHPLGKIDVSQAAVIDSDVILFVQGELEMENEGVVNAPLLNVTGGAVVRGPNDIAGAATINAEATFQAGSVLELVNGDLTIGDSSSVSGFRALDNSVVNVGAHTLILHDSNRAIVDDMTIAGGHIVAPNGLEIVTPGTNGTLNGFGMITAPEVFMESGGSVITATGAGGIVINGKFRNDSGTIDGTKYTFNVHPVTGDGGWTGAGAINARVVFNNGTQVNALANMTLGAALSDGVTFGPGSELHANTRTVTLVDSNGVTLPTLTDLNGGTVTSTQPMGLAAGRIIAGEGTIAGTLTANAGKLQPGFADGDRTSTLFFNGTLTLSPASEFTCEIAGLVDNDGLWVDGTANLSGTVRVELINGHVPQLGNSYFIMQIDGAMNGEFTSLIAPRGFHIVYGFSDSHVISLFYCPPDFDEDGFLTGLDFDLFVQAFENGDMAADYDEDGFLTGIDFDVFVQDFEHGCG